MRPAPGDLVERVLARTQQLGSIPAPPLRERQRAELVEHWWREDGLGEVSRDETGNVWARLRAGGSGAVVVCAHLDTVFDQDTPHDIWRSPTCLHGPGVGDDTVAVASLSVLDELLPEDHPATEVWVLATVGEEGLGNLTGIRAALEDPPATLEAVIAVEGNYLGRICTVGVGSHRCRFELRGPGGHAWESADAPSAVHAAAGCVAAVDALERPRESRTSVNVGRLRGGEAINARARKAWFEVDVRADEPDALGQLREDLHDKVGAAVPDGVDLVTEILGDRPAGRIAADHPLVLGAIRTHERAGLEPELVAASTDANAAHAAGIPAITVGVTTGEGEHTPKEFIHIDPLGTGLRVLADTVAGFAHQEPT